MIIRFNQLLAAHRRAVVVLPEFLLPAFSSPHISKPFSSTSKCRSRIGGEPLSLPPNVDLQILEPPVPKNRTIVMTEQPKIIEVKGPLGILDRTCRIASSLTRSSGKMTMQIPPYMSFDHDKETRKATLKILDREERKQREMWGMSAFNSILANLAEDTNMHLSGTTRAYLNNHILGVSEGHTAILRLVGVGYRATVEPSAVSVQPEYPGQKFVSLKVGYSHPIELGLPLGMKASTPQPTRILLEGIEKEVVNQFAAKIRKWRVPEPYKGKGIFVNGETIKLKAKKIK